MASVIRSFLRTRTSEPVISSRVNGTQRRSRQHSTSTCRLRRRSNSWSTASEYIVLSSRAALIRIRAFANALTHFESEMDPEGPFFFGDELGWVDILIAPWGMRLRPVLTHYRGFEPELITDSSTRFHKWLKAIQAHPAVKATTSTDELYTDSYSRYSQNLPFTSQVSLGISAAPMRN